MSGPIVRSGPSPEFSKNWEQVFGKQKKKSVPSGETPKAKKSVKKKKKSTG